MISQARLKKLLTYEADTGVFVWLARDRNESPSENAWRGFNSRYAGSVAGCIKSNGYRVIMVDKQQIYAHRLAWLYVSGAMPTEMIDHIDGDTLNNAFANLRPVSCLENNHNRSMTKVNRSGVNGVHWSNSNNGWVAQIKVEYKVIHLGTFLTIRDAAAARKQAERDHGFHANHGRNASADVMVA